MTLNSEDSDLLADLLVKWEEAFDDGNDIPASEFCTDYPHLTTELQTRIDGLKQTAWLKRDAARPLTDDREAVIKSFTGELLVNRYRLDELLGRGGYGQVYRAFDFQLRRVVAVKIGHARTSSDLLLEEARRVARLNHSGIVGVFDCGEHEGMMFLVFELVEGRNLADVIRTKRLAAAEAVGLVATVADALHHAHKQGCLHRDIKPENILIDTEGTPRIADFGVACTLHEIRKGRAAASGTLQYMSPEQLMMETQLLDGRCDVHALGVLLFELLAGQAPFQARNQSELREQILFRQPILLRAASPTLPAALEAVCSKAMAKHPADRFESAEVMAKELRRWLERSRKTKRWLLLALLLILITSAGLAAAAWTKSGPPLLPSESTIHFDGQTRIITPVKRELPVTLEAWVSSTTSRRRPEGGTT